MKASDASGYGPARVWVAVDFDPRAGELVRAATQLCRQGGLEVQLVHCLQGDAAPDAQAPGAGAGTPRLLMEEDEDPLLRDEPGPFGQPDHPRDEDRPLTPEPWPSRATGIERDEELEEQARSHLRALAERHGEPSVTAEPLVLWGRFPDRVTEALAGNPRAVLGLVGATSRARGFWGRRRWPIRRLLSRSSTPVLVLPGDETLRDFAQSPLRLMVADDLHDSTNAAVRFAMWLVNTLRLPVNLLHIHVEPVNSVGFTFSSESRLSVWPEISVEDRLVNDYHETLKENLRLRGKELKQRVKDFGGSYRAELWHGSVREELERATDVHDADLCVFGRHHRFRRQPVGFGQMSFGSMLELSCPLLVAPTGTSEPEARRR